jgi:sialic acid synthase SpsE
VEEVVTEFTIAGRKIGLEYPPLVIAEIGINHEGSLETAKSMVDAAKLAGVEVIKHQTHVVADEMSQRAKSVIPGNTTESIYEVMERCALSADDEYALMEYTKQQGMIFISTPFSRAAANRLQKMGVPAYKIGSGECNNYPLLEHVAEFGKPIILSTGMNTIASVRKAVAIFKKHEISYALLHTTNIYPTPHHLVRLGGMEALANEFSGIPVGLSDHTTDNYACLGAVALGATILERHFTDSMDRPGPDIVCSMDVEACRELIKASKIIFAARGGEKEPALEEQPTIDFAFATVVTIKPVKSGEIFSKQNLWVKRPGTGELLADRYQNIIGQRSTRDIPIDTHLVASDVQGDI